MKREIAPGVFIIGSGSFSSNAYLLESGGKRLLIDSGDGMLPINFTPEICLLTHGHRDHTAGVASHWPRVYLHRKDMFTNERTYFLCPPQAKPYDFINLTWGNFALQVMHTPGHTLGSISILEKTHGLLFSGDTKFAFGDHGRTDLGGDEQMMQVSLSLLQKLDYKLLCPGHGSCEPKR